MEVLANLSQNNSTPDFQQKFKNAKFANHTGILGEIIEKLSREEVAHQEAAKAAQDIADKEAIAAAKAAQEDADRRSKEAVAKAAQEEADRRSKEAAAKAVKEEYEKKPTKITINVLDSINSNGSPAITKKILFGGFTTGYSWKTNQLATNIFKLKSESENSDGWVTNIPIADEPFNSAATNEGFCFLKKSASQKEVIVTISSLGRAFTNQLTSQPIIIENNSLKIDCKVSQEISQILNIFTNSKYTFGYEILNQKIQSNSLDGISNALNEKNNSLKSDIQNAENNLKNWESEVSKPTPTPTPNASFESLERAGEILSQGFIFKAQSSKEKDGFPEILKTYKIWLSADKNQKNGESSYKEYLHQIFKQIYKVDGGFTPKFWEDGKFTQFKLEEDFSYFINPSDISVSLKNLQNKKTKSLIDRNDELLLKNISLLFTKDNLEKLQGYLNPPKLPVTPDYKEIFKDAKTRYQKFQESLTSLKSRITINESGHPIMIFTAP
jgi:hypothetical protein